MRKYDCGNTPLEGGLDLRVVITHTRLPKRISTCLRMVVGK